jgi:4-hydroxybenzoate polyprenyltransferase
MTFLKTLVTRIEQTPIGLNAGFLSFLAIIFIRNQLELVFEQTHNLTLSLELNVVLTDHVHVVLAWSYVFLLSVVSLAIIGKRSWQASCRIALVAFPLIWIPPIFDGLSGNSGAIVYQYNFDTFISSFLGLFLPWVDVAYVTVGVRIEVFVVSAFTVIYLLLVNEGKSRYLRAILCALMIYCAIFSMGYLPAILGALVGASHIELLSQSVLGVNSTRAPILWYLPIVIPLLALLIYKVNQPLWGVFTSCIRIDRLAIYAILAFGGFYSATQTALIGLDWLNTYDLIYLSAAILAIALAFIAMTALNDLCDTHIDQISNTHRPLIRQPNLVGEYKSLVALGVLASLSLCFLFKVTQPALLITLLSLSAMYSLPPFRLRRFLILAPLCLTIIGLACFIFGMAIVWNNSTPEQVNMTHVLSIGVLFFIASQFKDIKDIEGDRLSGVQTIATLLGPSKAYTILGIAIILAFMCTLFSGFIVVNAKTIVAGIVFLFAWLKLKNSETLFYAMGLSLLLLSI